MFSICNDWEFTDSWSDGFCIGEGEYEKVRLPHNVRELPLHYASPEYYEGIYGYRTTLFIDPHNKGRTGGGRTFYQISL